MLDSRCLAVDVLGPIPLIEGLVDRMVDEPLDATFRGTRVRLSAFVRLTSSDPNRLVFKATYECAGEAFHG